MQCGRSSATSPDLFAFPQTVQQRSSLNDSAAAPLSLHDQPCLQDCSEAQRTTHFAQIQRQRLLVNVIILANMENSPNWTFYHHDGPTEEDVMPRLVAEFPGFRLRWEKHLEFWKSAAAGDYNDIAEFVRFIVEDLYPSSDTQDIQRAFDLMEHWLVNGNQSLRNLISIGFLESVQNVASWQAFGKDAFLHFLGPQCRQAWNEIERVWAGKTSLMEVVRAETKNGE